MRTTTKRSTAGKNKSSRQPEKHNNISAKAAAAMEQARLQEYKEQQERPEKQLTDLSERAIVDIAVSLEDIARGNGGRKTAATKGRERKASAGGSGRQERESPYGQPTGKEYFHSSEPNAIDSYTADQVELEPDAIKLIPRNDSTREPMGNMAKQQAGDLPPAKKDKGTMQAMSPKAPAKDKPLLASQYKKEQKRSSQARGSPKARTGSTMGKRKDEKGAKQDKRAAQDQQTRRRGGVKPIPVATKAMEYAAEFNKETEELARRTKQARNAAKATQKTGETTVKIVKGAAKGIAQLARIAIAAIKGIITALMIGGAVLVPVVIVIAVLAAFISSPFSLFAGADTMQGDEQSDKAPAIAVNLPETVLRYKPIVERECTEQGIPQYVDVILAIMMQESGGRVPDVMQSSASAGLPNNSLQPEQSIKQGVKYFKSILDSAAGKGIDFDTCLQAYNYGVGFVGYVEGRGKAYTFELASQFSDEKAAEMGVAKYGDKEYVPHVYRYLQGTGNVVLSDNPIGRHLNKLYAELYTKIGAESAKLEGAEQSEVVYGTLEGDATNNAIDVLAVFAVRATAGAENGDGYTLGEIGDEQLQVLTRVFWDMHSIKNSMSYKQVTVADEEGSEEQATVLIKTITVSVKSPGYMAEQYKFDASAKGALNEMLTDYRSELLAFVSVSPGGVDLSDAELAVIIRELPAGDKGAAIVKVAFTRLGDPYHQELRFTGRYIDCSGLSMWSYKQLGINIPGTAAEQGRFCVENDVVVSRAALVPGDLVFYSDKSNGRYMNITHVAIYVGDGMIIDASSSRGQVVYRKMWGSPIMYGRPHIL